MKRLPFLLPLLALLLVPLCGCGGHSASPDYSRSELMSTPAPDPADLPPDPLAGNTEDIQSMTLSRWDGETLRTIVVNTDFTTEALALLPSPEGAPGAELAPPEAGTDFWGLQITASSTWEYEAAWSQGVWTDSTGRSFAAEVDSEALWALGYGEAEERVLTDSGIPYNQNMPVKNQRFLCLRDGAWRKEFLTQSPALKSLDGVVLTCAPGPKGMECVLRNGSGETLAFPSGLLLDTWYYLQVQLDGDWYYVPYQECRHYSMFPGESPLEPGDSLNFQPWLGVYLPLPGGNYRLVKPFETPAGCFTAAGAFSMQNGTIQAP